MDQSVSVPIHDREEESPLLGTSRHGNTRHSIRGLLALRIILCMYGLFVAGFFVGQRFKLTPENTDLKAPPRPIMCNLGNAENHTSSYSLEAGYDIKILDFTFDEGIVGTITVNVNDDASVRDIVLARTLRFSSPAMSQAYKNWNYLTHPRSSVAFTSYFLLDFTLRERQSILYEDHQCTGVDLVITVPKDYAFERLDLKSNYMGNIEIQSINVETLNVKAANGSIHISDTSAAVSALEAPAGAIDAQVTIDTRLRTSSGEDTKLVFFGTMSSWAELESVSEKNLTVIYKGEGAFRMQSTTRPKLSKYLENVVNITNEDEHTLEGYIGVKDEMFPTSLPRLTMTGHDTNLYLLPPRRQVHVDESSEIKINGAGKDTYFRIAV